MDPLSEILALSAAEGEARGLVFTPREIYQQPESWRRTYETVLRLAPELLSFLTLAGILSDTSKRPSVFLIGAGTSDYVGKTLTALLRRSWQTDVCATPSTDLLTSVDDLMLPGKPHLWISFSRSGDSSEGVAVLEAAFQQRPDIHHLIVCCNAQGRMAQSFSDRPNVCRIILDDEVNDRGLAMTSSFSNMVIAGQCLAHISDLAEYEATLDSLLLAGQKLLAAASEETERLVEKGFAKICFLGTGPLHGVAVEASLKVLELTAGRVVTFSESFLGVRHGPMSAIDDETLVVGFISGEPLRSSYEIDVLEEIREKRLAREILTVAGTSGVEITKRLEKIGEVLRCDIAVADCYRPPLYVVVGQLLGLFSSMKLGLKPDAPSPSGAITRVVSRVRIY